MYHKPDFENAKCKSMCTKEEIFSLKNLKLKLKGGLIEELDARMLGN